MNRGARTEQAKPAKGLQMECSRAYIKRTIVEVANSLGFQRTVIASLAPMEHEARHYQDWIDSGFAASMNYLKRNPVGRNSPSQLVSEARCAIIVSVSYYTEPPPSPGPFFGRVASYAVGADYHHLLRRKLGDLKSLLEKAIGRPLVGKSFADDVHLNERALAARHGLGFAGRNTLIIGPKLMGSYNFIGELLTDLELDADEKYIGTCGKCFRCGIQCPTNAIQDPGGLDANLCISYLTIENKEGIPLELRPKVGRWVFGCDVCQMVCPYNQKPPETPWPELRPTSGVGHHIDLLSLLAIKDENEFLKRFGHTALRRPKRRGLVRNALVVMGNCLREEMDRHAKDQLLSCLFEFAQAEPDAMLKEHATWAIAQAELEKVTA